MSPADEIGGNALIVEPLARIPQIDGFSRTTLLEPGLIDRGPAVRAAVKAGVLGMFLGIIPILGIVLTGSLCVYFYRRERGFAPPAGAASRLGGAAGILAFAINALLIAIRVFALHARDEYIDLIVRVAQTLGYSADEAKMQAAALLTPAGMTVALVFGLIFTLLLSGLGGAVASWFFRSSSNS